VSSSGSTTDAFKQKGQQNESPDVKFNLVCICTKLNFTSGDSFC